ncbi:hypothetical protein Dda3937_04575 [Dickeya dadantii 3937]|uniref:Uncharacterized protein n=1 Tax=Dickeya dadantii (strain 3937) TaxID=198628 RepID=E0SBA1_DICD3|nr:hypothetical protein Dda3937_04575 [Dickeya dadantii 3937]
MNAFNPVGYRLVVSIANRRLPDWTNGKHRDYSAGRRNNRVYPARSAFTKPQCPQRWRMSIWLTATSPCQSNIQVKKK